MTPEQIYTLRSNLGLNQAQFGQLFGVHPMTVSKWEREQLKPNIYQVSMMSEFWKAAKNRKIKDTLAGVLVGAGIAAAIFLLLKSAK